MAMGRLRPETETRKVYCLLPMVFLMIFLAGCSNVSQLTTNQSKISNNDVYKIAVAAPQVGPYKELGLSIVYSTQLAVDQKNELGGIHGKQIQLITVDDGGLAGEGTWRAKNLTSEMILGVIGHLNSDISIPASEIYSKSKIPQITPASTSPFFTERASVRGYVFRTIGRDDEQGKVAAKFAKEKDYKKIAVLYNNRSYGLSLASEFEREITSLPMSSEIEIVSFQRYKVDTSDFLHEMQNLKANIPQLVFFVGEYGDAAKFLKELKRNNLKIDFLGSEGVFDNEFIYSAGGASEGALVISLPEVKEKSFIEQYKKKFKKELGVYSANSFDAANILISAIEKVKEKDPDKIAKAIRETKDYPGLIGKISFDLKGDLIGLGFSIYKVNQGMFTEVK